MSVLPSILSSKKNLPFHSVSSRLIRSLPTEMWQLALAYSGSIPLLQRGFWVVLEKLWASVKNWVLARTQNANIPTLHFLHLGNCSNNCQSSSRQDRHYGWATILKACCGLEGRKISPAQGAFQRGEEGLCSTEGRMVALISHTTGTHRDFSSASKGEGSQFEKINIYQCCNQLVISGS